LKHAERRNIQTHTYKRT